MDNLNEAFKLLDCLSGDETKAEIVHVLNKAIEISDDCIDAVVLLARFADDSYERERLLIETLNNKSYIDLRYDDIMARQYIRLINEVANFYFEYGRLPLALKYFNKLKELRGNIYNVDDKLYGLRAYFGHLDNYLEVNEESKLLVDMIYSFERSEYAKAKEYRNLLIKLRPGIIAVLDGKENDEKANVEAANLLKDYAYYINRVEDLIYFMRNIDD